jgi:surfactin synthase thioesterase subunit/acyl transferase domain-containing protein
MPTYPFQRKRYWLEPVAPSTPASADAVSATDGIRPVPPAHPLLGEPVRDGGSLSFETTWSLDRLPYLRDHRVGGTVVLPTALAVEAALAAGRALFADSALAIEGLVHHEMLRFAAEGAHRVRMALMSIAKDRANFSLASLAENATWRTHITGVVTAAAEADEPAEEAGIASRCRRVVAPERFYASLRSAGLDYGPAFCGITELRCGGRVAVSRVQLPPSVASDGYGVHPAFLDACLHVFPAVLGDDGKTRRRELYLPVSIERLRVYQPGAARGTVTTALREPSPNSDRRVVDVRVVDQESRPVLRIDGLMLHARPAEALAHADASAGQPALYNVRWEARPRSSTPPPHRLEPGTWLVFADRDGTGEAVAAELGRRGQHCHLVFTGRKFSDAGATWRVDPRRPDHFHRLLERLAEIQTRPLRGVAFLWGCDSGDARATPAAIDRDQRRGVGAALFVTQALLQARATDRDVGRFWLVTRNVQWPTRDPAPVAAVAAMLWGFGRTVALEAPGIWGGLIDLGPAPHADEAARIAVELLEPDGETQLALRDGIRYLARLDRLTLDNAAPDPPSIRADATYLITGGLGMLGLRTARHLVEKHGARSLVLVSRRPPLRTAQRTIAALRARGARVRVISADVARDADMRRMLNALRGLPPLRGIFHGAGALDDAVLARMTSAQLTRAAAAKVRGSWLLHQHTRARPIDVFVLHSSLLSVTGSPGQANYTAANAFLDVLVSHRRAIGLPGTVLNWGPWAEGGMARSTGARGEAIWKARGIRYLAPDAAMRALDAALRLGVAQAIVADVDWPRFLGQLPAATPFYEALQTSASREAVAAPVSKRHDLLARLQTAHGTDRRSLVLEVVRDHVMTELGFTEPIDTRQPLSELGLDSLMSVNLANRLEVALGVPVPVAKLISGPSIERLVNVLVGDVDGVTLASASNGASRSSHLPADTVESAATLGDGWLVIPRRRPAATMRLVCFPFAGAGAAPFRPWAETLHPSIELIAVEPPGRASRIHEPAEGHLERYLTRLGDALSTVLDRPAAFFGHCLGGLIAWEMARRLRGGTRLDLRAFFVAGVRPPQRLTREGAFEHGLLERLLRHAEFDPLRPMHEQPDEVFVEIPRHFEIPATDDFLAQPELRKLLLPTVRADFELTAGYRYAPEPAWDVPITCFAGLDDPYVSREDAAAWSERTRRSFRLHWRPGAHFLVVDDREFIVTTINRELTA